MVQDDPFSVYSELLNSEELNNSDPLVTDQSFNEIPINQDTQLSIFQTLLYERLQSNE